MAILIHFISLTATGKKKRKKKKNLNKLFTILFTVFFVAVVAVPSVEGLMKSDYVNAEICYSTDLFISKFKVTSFLVASYDGE